MVRHKNFGTPAASSDEPITFELYGDTFRCSPAIQGTALLKFISAAGSDNPDESANAVLDFLHLAIAPADREKFEALTTSEDTIVPLETLAEVMEWLVEQYSGRPTEPPSLSEPGDMITGPMPMAVPSSPESVSVS